MGAALEVRTSRPSSSLELPVTALPGIGDDSAKLLERIEIRTIGDLLWHLPRTYADFSKFTPLRSVRAEQEQTVEAILGRIAQRRTARGQLMTEVELLDPGDRSPTNVRATWFGRQFIKERYPEGQLVRLSGKVRFFGRLRITRGSAASASISRSPMRATRSTWKPRKAGLIVDHFASTTRQLIPAWKTLLLSCSR